MPECCLPDLTICLERLLKSLQLEVRRMRRSVIPLIMRVFIKEKFEAQLLSLREEVIVAPHLLPFVEIPYWHHSTP